MSRRRLNEWHKALSDFAQIKWMEAHLERLNAAQVRTKTFYDALDTEQKTIFDLFWTVMHQRTGLPG